MELLTRVNVGSEFKQDVIIIDPTILSENRICAIWACNYWGILGWGVVACKMSCPMELAIPLPPTPLPLVSYIFCIFQRLGLGSRPTSSGESCFFFCLENRCLLPLLHFSCAHFHNCIISFLFLFPAGPNIR
jgi:hypothetical protein